MRALASAAEMAKSAGVGLFMHVSTDYIRLSMRMADPLYEAFELTSI